MNHLSDAALRSRLQFGFTITYHYLFPQLTMGLAWFLVYWKRRALWAGDGKYNQAARFWTKIFGINFALEVVTGMPIEFQFGTNWADVTTYAGGVIGQALAMEGMFAFFLESAVAALGAFYTLRGLHSTQAQLYLRAGTFTALLASVLVAFPTGDQQAKMVANHQPVTLAAMIGEPNIATRRLENLIEVPGDLSFLAYGKFRSSWVSAAVHTRHEIVPEWSRTVYDVGSVGGA